MLKKPAWSMPAAELHRWQKFQGVSLVGSCLAQVVFKDLDDPVGVAYQKPLRLNKESGCLTGVFVLNSNRRKDKNFRPYYVVGRYDKYAKVFIVDLQGDLVNMLLDNNEITYLSLEGREKVNRSLNRQEACLEKAQA